jgi:hypothetical protein
MQNAPVLSGAFRARRIEAVSFDFAGKHSRGR